MNTCMVAGRPLSLYYIFVWLQEDPPAGVSGAPGENNILLWNAVIFGPHDTPFEVNMEFYEKFSFLNWLLSNCMTYRAIHFSNKLFQNQKKEIHTF